MPIHALNALRVFKESEAPPAPSGPVVVNKPARAQTAVGKSDGTAAKLARVSPATLAQPSEAALDKQIEKKLNGDEPLLERVKAIFTSYEDKENFLKNLQAVRELYKQGNIEFHDIRDPSSILRRLAFQFTFIGFSPPIEPVFKLKCRGFLPEDLIEKDARSAGQAKYCDHLNYRIDILDIDENRFIVNGKNPIIPREIVEDFETAHVVQFYLRDCLGINSNHRVDLSEFNMFDMFAELPEHLKTYLYKSIDEPDSQMKARPRFRFDSAAHKAASSIEHQIFKKLKDWKRKELVHKENLPQCLRAYTVIFSLVNPKEIPRDNFPLKYLVCVFKKCKDSVEEQNIVKLFSDDQNTDFFKKIELKEEDLELMKSLIKKMIRNSAKNKSSLYEEATKLASPILEQQQKFTDRVVASILSINDPKTLFEVAKKTIENGGYVLPKN